MKKNILKYTFIVALSILLLIPIVTSLFFKLETKKVNKLLLKQELAQKEISEKLQKEEQEKIYLLGKFDPSQREDFILIPTQYTISQKNKDKMYLRKEALYAFLEMAEAANESEVELKIASATRNFDYQKDIWNKKWTGYTLVEGKNLLKSIPDGIERFKKILEYSAVPGTSRHHFGTDIDINDANSEYFNKKEGKKVYEWLTKNAYRFGFCQVYNLKGSDRPTGYNEEKWHWSYMPLARALTQEYKNLIKDSDIKGFNGDKYVSSLNLINDYVLSINPECI